MYVSVWYGIMYGCMCLYRCVVLYFYNVSSCVFYSVGYYHARDIVINLSSLLFSC